MHLLEASLLSHLVPTESWEPKPSSLVCHMANETTTSSLTGLTNSSLVQPVVIMALSEQPGFAIRNCREFDITNQPTSAAKIPTQTSYWGSANDRGAGVATAFDGTQGTALSNTQVSASSVTCTAVEYGVAHQVIDNVGEDSVLDGLELMNLFTNTMLFVLQLALDDDYIALFASISNSVGVTNTTLTVANLVAAQQGIRTRGTVADSIAYVLDNKQAQDMETQLQSANAAAAVFALSADRLLNYAPTGNNGMDTSRKIATFRGIPVYSTGLTDTANGAVDVVGCLVCPTSQYNDASGATTHGIAWKRLPRFETQRQAKARGLDVVMTMRAGTAELQDGSGTMILSKA